MNQAEYLVKQFLELNDSLQAYATIHTTIYNIYDAIHEIGREPII